MREIKFRGLSVLMNRWIYGYGIKTIEGKHSRLFTDSGYYEVHRGSEGQFTGLLDKNDVEIFEGDILTSTEYPFQDENGYNYHGVVDWSNEDAAFFVTKRLVNSKRSGISDGISGHLTDYDVSEFEVIDNVYENSDLLATV